MDIDKNVFCLKRELRNSFILVFFFFFCLFHNRQTEKSESDDKNTNTGEGSDFIVAVEKSSHMQTAMSKPCIINILLANQREINKNKNKKRAEGTEQSVFL